MLRPRFYTNQALAAGTDITLDREPSRHIAKALRMQQGDALCLFNGDGSEAHGHIESIDKHLVAVSIDDIRNESRESPLSIRLAISISRGDRVDTIVQKATELGVVEIWPLISERTEVRLDAARQAKKREHWERIAISACEQCGRNSLPQIAAISSFKDILDRAKTHDGLKLMLHTGGEHTELPATCTSVTLLVGPEGGFSAAEAELTTDLGFQSMLLGPRVLRTETAPLAVIAVAQARWGDFTL